MKTRVLIRPAGVTGLGFLGHLTALLLLISGCQGVYVALQNREPLEISTADFIAQKPDAKWIVLKDAEVSLTEAAYKAWMGNISEIFIPVRSKGQPMTEPIHILLSTDDEEVAAALKKLRDYGGTKEKTVKLASRHADDLFMQKTISGVTRHGFFSDIVTRFKLARLNLKLADDFVIVNDGATPTPYFPILQVAGALLIWFFMFCDAVRVAEWRRRQRKLQAAALRWEK